MRDWFTSYAWPLGLLPANYFAFMLIGIICDDPDPEEADPLELRLVRDEKIRYGKLLSR